MKIIVSTSHYWFMFRWYRELGAFITLRKGEREIFHYPKLEEVKA